MGLVTSYSSTILLNHTPFSHLPHLLLLDLSEGTLGAAKSNTLTNTFGSLKVDQLTDDNGGEDQEEEGENSGAARCM